MQKHDEMDKETFKQQILPLQSDMQLLAEHMIGNSDDAEDTVQEVFLALWERRKELDRVVRLKSYCMQMVRHRCIDILREHADKNQRFTNLQNISDAEIQQESEETAAQSELLYKMLETLPEKQQQAIQMKYIENRSTKEIETALQMSSNNVYTTLSRGIQVLREQLKKKMNDLATK